MGPWSMDPAARMDVGSGFESHPWAQVPWGNGLSILTNIFDVTSSQAKFNGGKAQVMKAPVYTQAFEAGKKEADLYLTTGPYGLTYSVVT
ncbi:hypothetical protein DSO57_1008246 [Entomophthora muscae]|uniref:Uncharacterized protein n=1 Tax=Entomophthora muscae TaxID=34485 RepID=A0ACC2THS1_9FUNG|nr:hypothetical protein DSO57_1008246 [Entomophthora muscae]